MGAEMVAMWPMTVDKEAWSVNENMVVVVVVNAKL